MASHSSPAGAGSTEANVVQAAVPVWPQPAVFHPCTLTAYAVDAARFENTWDRPDAAAHPLPLDTRYRTAPLAAPQLTETVLAVAAHDTTGAPGGAAVAQTALGCTWIHALVADARHQKKNVYDTFAANPVNTVESADPANNRPPTYRPPAAARPAYH